MKYLAVAILAIACTASTASAQVEMPRAFRGEWCADGGTCPNGWMTVTKNRFTGGGVRCDLKKADSQVLDIDFREYRGVSWKLTFKCTDSKKLVKETWFFIEEDDMLVVVFDLPNGSLRFVQYLPRTNRDQG
jgi:opacity protein-like surface antigen